MHRVINDTDFGLIVNSIKSQSTGGGAMPPPERLEAKYFVFGFRLLDNY